MAIKLENKPNVEAPSAAYPYGAIKDNTGSNDGTPVNTAVYGDFHQFFARMLGESGVTPNDLPDNQTNGFQYFEALRSVISSFIPPGIITMWSGSVSAIPAGWSLCDGTGPGIPDLRGQFVVGYDSRDDDYSTIGGTGGDKTISLSKANLPRHTHGASGLSLSEYKHRHAVGGYTISYSGGGNEVEALIYSGQQNHSGTFTDENTHSHSVQGNTENGASDGLNGTAHENRPPYYVVAYIIKM